MKTSEIGKAGCPLHGDELSPNRLAGYARSAGVSRRMRVVVGQPPQCAPVRSHIGRCGAGRGFSLIELVVVVLIVAILAAIAYPIYTHYVEKSRRSAAVTALQRAAAAEEKYYATNNGYAATLANIGYSSNSVDVPSSSQHWYTMSAASGTGGYALEAVPAGVQAGDACGTYKIYATGAETISGQASAKTATECWSGS